MDSRTHGVPVLYVLVDLLRAVFVNGLAGFVYVHAYLYAIVLHPLSSSKSQYTLLYACPRLCFEHRALCWLAEHGDVAPSARAHEAS